MQRSILYRAFIGMVLMACLMLSEFGLLVMTFGGCSSEPPEEVFLQQSGDDLASAVGCFLDAPRYPTTPSDTGVIYAGRAFLADGNHLGHDMALAEGTPIYALGCGVVRVYRPANGYGQLAVVVEYKLAQPIQVRNGLNELVSIASFLGIYGHLRVSSDRNGTVGVLGVRSGDLVSANDILGYVDQDTTNGDGGVHLHLGIRLQTAQDASASDVNWFRGYDGDPSQRKWYANPVSFMETLTSSVMPVTWHPSGTVLKNNTDASFWMVDADGVRHFMGQSIAASEGLMSRAIPASQSELACLEPGSMYASPRASSMLVKFSDSSTVYEYSDPGLHAWRRAFVSYEAFLSWGWHDDQIVVRPASERAAFFEQTEDRGFRTIREGTLVKADGDSEVSIVSEDRRLPIVDWPTFLALGYRQEQIVSVPKSTIDIVAGPRGPLVTPALIGQCLHPSSCVVGCGPHGQGGGLGGEFSDVPDGKVRFHYDGPIVGAYQFFGMWDPPGPTFYDWTPSTFALCPDLLTTDASFECLLDMPSGTQGFLFTVRLPDGRWWGDLSCSPTGGCNSTIGTVTLTGPSSDIPFMFAANGNAGAFMNGYVDVVP